MPEYYFHLLEEGGQNLVRDRHLEFFDNDQTLNSTLVKRSAYAKLTWSF